MTAFGSELHGARVGGVGEAKGEGGGPGEGPGGCLQVEVALLASQEGHQGGHISQPSSNAPPVQPHTESACLLGPRPCGGLRFSSWQK